ncbi:MAG: DUF4468 domain-containing protein [Cytophagaceae bacterium]
MRKIYLVFLLFFSLSLSVKAQDVLPIDEATEKVMFIEVVDATGITGKELYKVMKDWALSKGLKIKEENAAEGEMQFGGVLEVPYERVKGKSEPGNVSYNFYLFAKDNKYRYVITDFVHAGTNATVSGGKLENQTPECGPTINQANWLVIKKKTRAGMDELVEELRKKVKAAQNDPTKKKDW